MAVWIIAAAVACSSSTGTNGDAGGTGGAGGGGGSGGGPPPAPVTCLDTRECVSRCADGDQACARACATGLPADAKKAFDDLMACGLQYCTSWQHQCVCDEQCYAEGRCVDQVDACAVQSGAAQAAAGDFFCDVSCH